MHKLQRAKHESLKFFACFYDLVSKMPYLIWKIDCSWTLYVERGPRKIVRGQVRIIRHSCRGNGRSQLNNPTLCLCHGGFTKAKIEVLRVTSKILSMKRSETRPVSNLGHDD